MATPVNLEEMVRSAAREFMGNRVRNYHVSVRDSMIAARASLLSSADHTSRNLASGHQAIPSRRMRNLLAGLQPLTTVTTGGEPTAVAPVGDYFTRGLVANQDLFQDGRLVDEGDYIRATGGTSNLPIRWDSGVPTPPSQSSTSTPDEPIIWDHSAAQPAEPAQAPTAPDPEIVALTAWYSSMSREAERVGMTTQAYFDNYQADQRRRQVEAHAAAARQQTEEYYHGEHARRAEVAQGEEEARQNLEQAEIRLTQAWNTNPRRHAIRPHQDQVVEAQFIYNQVVHERRLATQEALYHHRAMWLNSAAGEYALLAQITAFMRETSEAGVLDPVYNSRRHSEARARSDVLRSMRDNSQRFLLEFPDVLQTSPQTPMQ